VRDAWILGLLLASFGVLVTTHVSIAFRLVLQRPRYRGLLALVVVPLAPYFARENGWHVSFWSWCGAVSGYGVMLALALR
jgi:hypothetical protein